MLLGNTTSYSLDDIQANNIDEPTQAGGGPRPGNRRPLGVVTPGHSRNNVHRTAARGREACVKVVVIGATGTIGRAVVAALEGTHDVVAVSRTKSPITCDIANPDSIRAMYATVGRVDAVVVAAGDAVFKELAALTDADFQTGLRSKFMGQVNAVRLGFDSVSDGGSF